MNLPNKLTLLRVFLVPVFIILMYVNIPFHYIYALAVFAIASITDALDGYLARKDNLVTNFGKFLDPLADKVLVISALACFTDLEFMNAIPLIIIIAREFMVSGLRLVVANEGVVVPAGIWGKLKTAFTMITIVVALFMAGLELSHTYLVTQILIWISTVLTVISGGVYLKAFWKYIDTDK